MTASKTPPPPGRGAGLNPAGRFERLTLEEAETPETRLAHDRARQVPTEIYRDTSRSILSHNDSPDVGMAVSVNPYRGCEHGCIYCYARPGHEYLGLSAGLDFETKIFAKPEAPALLRNALSARGWRPRTVSFSGVTDCYQPIERRLELTRACVAVMADFRNPMAVMTKNALVTRDIDLFRRLADYNAVAVFISVTSLDKTIARAMEPRASSPGSRLRAIETLAQAGIPVNAMIAPVIPGLTDHEIPRLLASVANAGAGNAYYTVVRLPHGVKDLFQDWVRRHFPNRADKILNRIRAMRDGRLNDAAFGTRMRGEGIFAEQIAAIFAHAKKRHGLTRELSLSSAHFRRHGGSQGDLFDGMA